VCGRLISTAVFGVLVLVAGPRSLGATSYHPLEVGTEWHYASDAGETQSTVITGTRDVLGVLTAVRHEEVTEADTIEQVFENFWTCDIDGNLYLHGAINYTYGFDTAYIPPLRWVQSPLSYGLTWTTADVLMCRLDGTDCWDPFDYSLTVYSEGNVSVPAGTFYSYGVGQLLPPPALRAPSGHRFDVLGRHLAATERPELPVTVEWYSEGVGCVQFGSESYPGHIMRLIEWTPSPVRRTTWGGVKSLYR
jgi:hypothetical protein